jgi:hypothetical protein
MTDPFFKFGRYLLPVFVSLLVLCSFNDAKALCVLPESPGNWVNVDPNTRGLTTAELSFSCQDVVINGKRNPSWHLRVSGKCHPNDCDWGVVGGSNWKDGYILFKYEQGFATRYVYVKYYPAEPGFDDNLYVYMWTDYRDSNRQDGASEYWFKRG